MCRTYTVEYLLSDVLKISWPDDERHLIRVRYIQAPTNDEDKEFKKQMNGLLSLGMLFKLGDNPKVLGSLCGWMKGAEKKMVSLFPNDKVGRCMKFTCNDFNAPHEMIDPKGVTLSFINTHTPNGVSLDKLMGRTYIQLKKDL